MKKIWLLCLLLYMGGNRAFCQFHWNLLAGALQNPENIGVLYADSLYLYAGGTFDTVSGIHMKGISRWNGVKWDSMGAGIDALDTLNALPNGGVDAFTTYHNKLYVGGGFGSLGKLYSPGIGTWDGSAWDTMPIQPFNVVLNGFYSSGDVLALTVINNRLYMGGDFTSVAGKPYIGIVSWNDTNWSSLNFPNNYEDFYEIDAICEYKGSIYVGGEFYWSSQSDSMSQILRYDSLGWHSVGGGIKGSADDVWSMAIYQGDLYVAGEFLKSEGNYGNNIQKWDGTKWSDVGDGTDYEIWNLRVYNGKLYATGQFDHAGGIFASKMAEWDGSKWCSLDTFNNTVASICVYQDSLYIGGGFGVIDGHNTRDMAEWVGGDYTANCGQPTGVNGIKDESAEVNVYPNPNNGNFTITLSNVSQKCIVKIYNVLGEQVYQSYLNAANTEINLSNQPQGVYLYRVINQSGSLIGEGKIETQK